MSRYLSSRFAGIEPYTPGEQPQDMQYVKLNTNENPYPPAPGVIRLINEAQTSRLNLYSDPTVGPLIQELARFYKLRPGQIFAGNGSDEVLAFAFLAFCDRERKVCFPEISYGFYKVFARLFNLDDARAIPLKADFSIDPEDYVNCGRNVVIANPNAPTGLSLSAQQIERIVKTNPGHVVIVDEAYVDFGGESCLELIGKYDNLLIVRTFSKSRSLAGARLGFAMGAESLIEDLNRMKFSFNPYNINRLTMLAGVEAVKDRTYFEDCLSKIVKTREESALRLKEMGFEVLPSKANFLFARHPALKGEAYYRALKQRGVLVRHFAQPESIADFVRITIGTPEQMEVLLQKTREILHQEG